MCFAMLWCMIMASDGSFKITVQDAEDVLDAIFTSQTVEWLQYR